MFVVFEGMDGSGKSKLIASIKERLKDDNIKTFITREPGGTPFSEKLRKLILTIQVNPTNYNVLTETCLIILAREDHINKVILPKLKAGYLVISDRFSLSTIAYQQIMANIDATKIDSLKKLIFTNDIKPDLTFFLDISPKLAIERIKGRINQLKSNGEDLKSLSYYELLRKCYHKAISLSGDRVIKIDSSLRLEKNSQEVYKLLLEEYNKSNLHDSWP